MPWTETTPVDERLELVTDAQSDRFTMAELCARYGVSRRVGYKWVHRYAEEGRHGLADRSRAPHHSPQAIPSEVAELLCACASTPKLARWVNTQTRALGLSLVRVGASR